MKNSIIILLSVLAITLTFSGCGGSEGSVSSAPTDVNVVDGGSADTAGAQGDNVDPTIGDTISSASSVSNTTISEDFGLNPSLGTPPPLPAS